MGSSEHRSSPAHYDQEACIRLANAIVLQAVKDYRGALRQLRRNPKNRIAMNNAMECERFFDGEWIQVLTSVDGQWLKNRLREEARDRDGKRVSEQRI